MNKRNFIIAALLLLIVSLFALPGVFAQTDPGVDTSVFSQIYEEVSPSVVAINVLREIEGGTMPGLPDVPQGGSGSGFVIDTEGHIVTNNHVVEGATSIEVEFFDGTLARAEIIGLDPDSDLAVIKVDLPEDKLYPVEFADSNELVVGETVLAIGSPFGQRWTLTSGIISALNRSIASQTEFSIAGVIQTDAAINPGNSGGPLLDLEGRVIGVNSQIISETRSNAGIGFAVPSNLTQRVARLLIEQGYVEYSYLGIRGGNVTLSLIEDLELANDFRGVVVTESMPGGPAARAGLQSAETTMGEDGVIQFEAVDVITAIDGTQLRGITDLIAYLAAETTPGDMVTLSVLRNGSEMIELDVRLMPRQ